MQNVTTKTRTRYLAAILAAILMCFMAIVGFIATAPKADHASTADEKPKVGIIVSENMPYYMCLKNSLCDSYNDKEYDVYTYTFEDAYGQREAIYWAVDVDHVNLLVVAPIYPTDVLAPALQYAHEKQVRIIVYGDINDKYPEETLFIKGDYYELGVNHAEWIYDDNPNINENSIICVYYHDDADGKLYRDGIVDGLKQYGFNDKNIECIIIDDIYQVIINVNRMYNKYSSRIAEIATYDSEIAKTILQRYYNYGFVDTIVGDGIGIRVFSCIIIEGVEEEDEVPVEHIESLADLIANASDEFLTNEIPPYTDIVDDKYYVLDCGFASGYSMYVTDKPSLDD